MIFIQDILGMIKAISLGSLKYNSRVCHSSHHKSFFTLSDMFATNPLY